MLDIFMKKYYFFVKFCAGGRLMVNIHIMGMDDDLVSQLKSLAASENRSINHQILFLLKKYLASRHQLKGINTPAQVLLDLSGSWEDDRPAEKILKKLKAERKNSKTILFVGPS